MKTLMVTSVNPYSGKDTRRYEVELIFEHDGLRLAICKLAKPHTGIIALLTQDGKQALNIAGHSFIPSYAVEFLRKHFPTKEPILQFLREKCLPAKNEKARVLTARLLEEYA